MRSVENLVAVKVNYECELFKANRPINPFKFEFNQASKILKRDYCRRNPSAFSPDALESFKILNLMRFLHYQSCAMVFNLLI